VIAGGKLRGVGAPDEIVGIKAHGMEILFELPSDKANAPGAATLLSKATRTGNRYRMHVEEAELYATLEQLKNAGARILSVTQMKASLEEFFMSLVSADRARAAAVDVHGK